MANVIAPVSRSAQLVLRTSLFAIRSRAALRSLEQRGQRGPSLLGTDRAGTGLVSWSCCSRPGAGVIWRLQRSRRSTHVTFAIDLANIERLFTMKSRPPRLGVFQPRSVYRLVAAALPLVLSGCSSDDPAPVMAETAPSFPAPASAAPGASDTTQMPAASAPTAGNTPTPAAGAPTGSASDGQPVMGIATPEGQITLLRDV